MSVFRQSGELIVRAVSSFKESVEVRIRAQDDKISTRKSNIDIADAYYSIAAIEMSLGDFLECVYYSDIAADVYGEIERPEDRSGARGF